jgi:NAD(P)-dependent dehydrogenase (short-subunit alcohol dehydrogenase family)
MMLPERRQRAGLGDAIRHQLPRPFRSGDRLADGPSVRGAGARGRGQLRCAFLAGFDFDDARFERRPYDPVTAYAQSKTADVLLAVGISRRWAGDGITANACAPGLAHTNLSRHLDAATLQMLGAQDAHGNRLTPPHFKTPAQAAATTALLAASPLLNGVTGRYFEENQEAQVIQGDLGILAGGPDATTGFVAEWSLDPAAADRLWKHALAAIS